MTETNEGSPLPTQPTVIEKGSFAIGSLIVGAAAFFVGWVPVLGFLAGATAVVLGLLAIRRSQSKPFAVAGVVLGSVAALTSIIVLVVAVATAGSVGMSPKTSTSSTPSPSPTASARPVEMVEVPSFVGLTLKDAKLLAFDIGLTPSSVSGSDDWIVTSSTPAAGVQAKKNSTISFEIQEPVVPTQTFTGSGDFVQPLTFEGIGYVTFACAGCSSNTVLKTNGRESLLVNTIGSYSGSHFINLYENSLTTQFEINANSAWTLTVGPVESAPSFVGSVAGTGDSAFLVTSTSSRAAITNDGSGNFAVWVYGSSTDLAVNTIGAYSGTVVFEAPAFVQVTSEGNWSITPQ